jgi:hypothetical protein
MPTPSILSILCFELTTFSTNWGICFSLEANPNRYNPALFGTFLAQRLRGRAPAYRAAALSLSPRTVPMCDARELEPCGELQVAGEVAREADGGGLLILPALSLLIPVDVFC